MVQVSAVSMLARSVRAKARYSPWAPLRTPSVERSGRRREPGRVGRRSLVGQPCLSHRFERERADAVEEPVPDLSFLGGIARRR